MASTRDPAGDRASRAGGGEPGVGARDARNAPGLSESRAEQREAADVRPHAGRPYVLATLHTDTLEMRELATTLGLHLLLEVFQGRDRPHAGTFFGKGKVDELAEWLSEWRAGITPEDWVWNGQHWIPEDQEVSARLSSGERSAWGGTAWLDPGDTAPDPSGKGDPLSAVGGAGRSAKVRGRGGPDARGIEGESAPAGAPEAGGRSDLLLILDEDVRPTVLFNLEERLGVEVWDRTRLILEIFSQHAHVKEARLQVELAKLQYEVPLVHEAVHRRRAGERPGFGGGGEYGVADYEDFIKRRMRSVKDELRRIRKERDVRRKVRRARFYLVSLAGYTNAGKSSLLNVLTDADTISEGTMFSTLATTTRRLATTSALRRREAAAQHPRSGTAGDPHGEGQRNQGGNAHRGEGQRNQGGNAQEGKAQGSQRVEGDASPTRPNRAAEDGETGWSSKRRHETRFDRPVLLTDTVGFIQALPSWLLDAFRSTLEEIGVSDVVLLVADVADPMPVLADKVRVCRRELGYLDVTCPVIVVLNKTDLVPHGAALAKRDRLVTEGLAREDGVVLVSSHARSGVMDLVGALQEALPTPVMYEARIPMEAAGQRLVSLMYGWGEVEDVAYGDTIVVRGACDPIHWKDLVREGVLAEAEIQRV